MPGHPNDPVPAGGPRDGLEPLPAHLDPRAQGRHRGRHGSRSGSQRAWLLVAKVVLALISCALLLAFAYGWQSYHDLNRNLHVLPIAKATPPSHHDIDGKDENILIVGNDDRTNMTDAEVRELKVGRDGGSLATDTMMIVHVPANGKRATLISLPRDAYVQIPGYGMNKLNAAYALAYTNTQGTSDQKRGAGATLLMQTITNLTGLTLDNFVQVDLLGFYRISNAIGGVSVDLCHPVDDTYAHNQATGEGGGSGLVLPAGRSTISGVQALEFVRQRHNLPRGDLDRVARQRYFLAAAFREIASAGTLLNPGRLSGLIKAVDNSLYVGPGFKLLRFAQQVADLSADNINGDTIPIVNPNGSSDVGSVEIVDPAQVQQFVQNLLGTGQAVLGNVKAADPSTVTVRVVNGSKKDGVAQQNATLLDQYGFHTSTGTGSTTLDATTIRYADGMQAAAKALAAHLPKNVVFEQSDVATLTLVVGADGMGVTPKSGSSTSPAPGSSDSSGPSGSNGPSGTSVPNKPLDAGCIN